MSSGLYYYVFYYAISTVYIKLIFAYPIQLVSTMF